MKIRIRAREGDKIEFVVSEAFEEVKQAAQRRHSELLSARAALRNFLIGTPIAVRNGTLQRRGEFEGVEPAPGRRQVEPLGSGIRRMQRGLESHLMRN